MTNKELADWLENLGAHDVYDVEMLKELDPEDAAVVPSQTVPEVRAEMEARGLGGWLNEEFDGRLFTGYVAAEALCRHRMGRLPDSVLQLQGRGSIHRECVRVLRETPDVRAGDVIQRFPT